MANHIPVFILASGCRPKESAPELLSYHNPLQQQPKSSEMMVLQWTDEDCVNLCSHVQQYGAAEWGKVSEVLGRSATLCALRWHVTYLDTVLTDRAKGSEYSYWELGVLFLGYNTLKGLCRTQKEIYEVLASWLPGRSAESIKQTIRSRIKAQYDEYAARYSNDCPTTLLGMLEAWPGPRAEHQACMHTPASDVATAILWRLHQQQYMHASPTVPSKPLAHKKITLKKSAKLTKAAKSPQVPAWAYTSDLSDEAAEHSAVGRPAGVKRQSSSSTASGSATTSQQKTTSGSPKRLNRILANDPLPVSDSLPVSDPLPALEFFDTIDDEAMLLAELGRADSLELPTQADHQYTLLPAEYVDLSQQSPMQEQYKHHANIAHQASQAGVLLQQQQQQWQHTYQVHNQQQTAGQQSLTDHANTAHQASQAGVPARPPQQQQQQQWQHTYHVQNQNQTAGQQSLINHANTAYQATQAGVPAPPLQQQQQQQQQWQHTYHVQNQNQTAGQQSLMGLVLTSGATAAASGDFKVPSGPYNEVDASAYPYRKRKLQFGSKEKNCNGNLKEVDCSAVIPSLPNGSQPTGSQLLRSQAQNGNNLHGTYPGLQDTAQEASAMGYMGYTAPTMAAGQQQNQQQHYRPATGSQLPLSQAQNGNNMHGAYSYPGLQGTAPSVGAVKYTACNMAGTHQDQQQQYLPAGSTSNKAQPGRWLQPGIVGVNGGMYRQSEHQLINLKRTDSLTALQHIQQGDWSLQCAAATAGATNLTTSAAGSKPGKLQGMGAAGIWPATGAVLLPQLLTVLPLADSVNNAPEDPADLFITSPRDWQTGPQANKTESRTTTKAADSAVNASRVAKASRIRPDSPRLEGGDPLGMDALLLLEPDDNIDWDLLAEINNIKTATCQPDRSVPVDGTSKRRKLASSNTSLSRNNNRNQLGCGFGDLADTGLGLTTCKSLDALLLPAELPVC